MPDQNRRSTYNFVDGGQPVFSPDRHLTGQCVWTFDPPQDTHEIVVKREPNADLYVAIRDSFDAARRQLQSFSGRQRGEVKIHQENHSPTGHVRKLYPADDYGFIETPDGREIYFHRNSVRNSGFDHLSPNAEVRFTEEEGEQGPQAVVVIPLGK